ncbi:DUF1576 domain-containing protein [Streptococcus suis]|nr:DUF1576 domain-containing protein [Streptococcus suis]
MTIKSISFQRKTFILLIGLFTLAYAGMMPDKGEMLQNYLKIISRETNLLQDFFAIAGFSATFLNTAMHFFVAYFLMERNNLSKINGLQVAAIGTFVGHSFFGTHLLNIIPILLGVSLYARWTGQSYKVYTTVSLFATATAPIVSIIAIHHGVTVYSILLAIVIGLLLGFIAPPLAEHYLKFHNGLSLYNYGFTTGMIGMFALLLFPYFNWVISSVVILLDTPSIYPALYFICIWLFLALFAVRELPSAMKQYPKLLTSSGRLPDDFIAKYGIHTALLNMTITGGIYLLIILLTGQTVNGPVLGGLLTCYGFSAFGVHIRNSVPISVGILAAALLLGQSITDTRFITTLLFGNGLAPIAGFYGSIYGCVAGFLHYNLVSTVFSLHAGFNLYNNGFTAGFVASFLFPIIEHLQEHTFGKRKKGK